MKGLFRSWGVFIWCYWSLFRKVISHTPVRSRFHHIHIVYKRNGVGSCLMNLIQKSYKWLHIFKIRNWIHCVAESWWNMPFKETRHGHGVADGTAAKLLRLWQHALALWRHAVWMRIMASHNAWIFITKLESAPLRNNGACVIPYCNTRHLRYMLGSMILIPLSYAKNGWMQSITHINLAGIK